MQLGIRALEDSLNLQKKKQPLIHCISNSSFLEGLEKGVLNYNGKTIISKDLEEYVEITSRADLLIITFDDLSENKVEAIEKSIRVARRKGIPIILNILGIDKSFFGKEITLRFINRYNINIVIGKIEEFEALILKEENLKKSVLSNYRIMKDVEFRYSLKKFSKVYRTKLVVKDDKYFFTDGFSEFYIKRYIKKENDLSGFESILSGLISIGVASASNTEESLRGILVAIIAMAVSEKNAEQKSLNYSDNINLIEYLLDEIKEINSDKLNKLQKINYLFIR